MARHPLSCARCRTLWSAADFADGLRTTCPQCGVGTEVRLFPALFRAPEAVAAAAPLTDESSCFFHAGRRAIVPCDGCGRFLCALCDVDFNGRHLCPSCVSAARAGQQEATLTTRRLRYDKIALNAIVLTVLLPPLWFFSPIAAPVALYLAIRHWRTPLSALPVGRARLVIAAALSTLIILGWLGLLVYWLAQLF